MLAVALFFGHADTYTWRGQTITYTGAELKHLPYAGAPNEELVLIWKTASDGVAASGSLTLPAADISARILAVGGGGAGGTVRATTYTSKGGGGGGGGYGTDEPEICEK